jgi:hypothetical protein
LVMATGEYSFRDESFVKFSVLMIMIRTWCCTVVTMSNVQYKSTRFKLYAIMGCMKCEWGSKLKQKMSDVDDMIFFVLTKGQLR